MLLNPIDGAEIRQVPTIYLVLTVNVVSLLRLYQTETQNGKLYL